MENLTTLADAARAVDWESVLRCIDNDEFQTEGLDYYDPAQFSRLREQIAVVRAASGTER